ncbi:hypothetical protein GCM10020331_086520 [Ectobacillus funiculus]
MVSELAAAIAHEVRNPLTVVRGFIQLTKENVTEQHKYFMETAILELDRAEGIITDYLNFAKPKSIHKERLHISQELLALLEFIQSYANLKGVHIESQIEGDLFITGDPLQFKQVILNLVKKNAVEATENQGSVLVKAYAQKQNRTDPNCRYRRRYATRSIAKIRKSLLFDEGKKRNGSWTNGNISISRRI